MNSRERVKRAITFQRPDRAPISHAILPAAQIKYGAALAEVLAEVHEDFGWHLLPDMPRADFPPLYKGGRHRDDFGVLWDVEDEGICGIPIEWPLEEWENYPAFTWPEFGAIHPFAPLDQAAGYLRLISELEDWLVEITTFRADTYVDHT
ncbi:MAG TPA: hypothetical protein PLZ36_16320, partial [Armatimonadota bacterium]|nr:hypothetical protein [Armatimonadota bacterium]